MIERVEWRVKRRGVISSSAMLAMQANDCQMKQSRVMIERGRRNALRERRRGLIKNQRDRENALNANILMEQGHEGEQETLSVFPNKLQRLA